MLNFEDILIKNLWKCKSFSARRLLKKWPNHKNWKVKKNTAHLAHDVKMCCFIRFYFYQV